MLNFVVKRLILAALVTSAVLLISFSLLYLAGDPAASIAGESASAADIQKIRELYGFDRPMLVQFFDWLWHALQGDFSYNFV